MKDITIRKAGSADVAAFLGLVRKLAAYECFEAYVHTTEAVLLRDGFGEQPRFAVFLAVYCGQPVGFVSFTVNYSIWYGKHFAQIDDVFVDEAMRGAGLGTALMKCVAAECTANDFAFARWTVETGNTRAITFYQGIGADVRERGVCSWMPDSMAALVKA